MPKSILFSQDRQTNLQMLTRDKAMIDRHFPCRAGQYVIQNQMCVHPEERVSFLIKLVLFTNSTA